LNNNIYEKIEVEKDSMMLMINEGNNLICQETDININSKEINVPTVVIEKNITTMNNNIYEKVEVEKDSMMLMINEGNNLIFRKSPEITRNVSLTNFEKISPIIRKRGEKYINYQ